MKTGPPCGFTIWATRESDAPGGRQPTDLQPRIHESLFLGALTSERFLTILRLHVAGTEAAAQLRTMKWNSTGTTEMEKENSLEQSAPVDRVELSLPVAPGSEISSETVAISVGARLSRATGNLRFADPATPSRARNCSSPDGMVELDCVLLRAE